MHSRAVRKPLVAIIQSFWVFWSACFTVDRSQFITRPQLRGCFDIPIIPPLRPWFGLAKPKCTHSEASSNETLCTWMTEWMKECVCLFQVRAYKPVQRTQYTSTQHNYCYHYKKRNNCIVRTFPTKLLSELRSLFKLTRTPWVIVSKLGTSNCKSRMY